MLVTTSHFPQGSSAHMSEHVTACWEVNTPVTYNQSERRKNKEKPHRNQ